MNVVVLKNKSKFLKRPSLTEMNFTCENENKPKHFFVTPFVQCSIFSRTSLHNFKTVSSNLMIESNQHLIFTQIQIKSSPKNGHSNTHRQSFYNSSTWFVCFVL